MNSDASTARQSSPGEMISVVLPVYNEAGVLPTLLDCLTETLAGCGIDFEILFVDDGSSDGSSEVLDYLAAREPNVRVIHLARNFGHQAAIQAGLAYTRGDAVVLMDSDMQDAPEAIPQFLAKWREGYEVVYAVRTHRKENALKRCLFASFHRLLSRMASVRIPVDAGIFGLVDRRVAAVVLALAERDRYFPGLRSWAGFRQTGVEVERNARYDDHPRVSLSGLFRLAKTAIFSFSVLPLTIFYLVGLAAGATFLAVGGFSLFCKLFTGLAVPGWTSPVLVGSFFAALNALGICILGEYVVRIYDQVRARPIYLVDRTVNLDLESVDATRAKQDAHTGAPGAAGDLPHTAGDLPGAAGDLPGAGRRGPERRQPDVRGIDVSVLHDAGATATSRGEKGGELSPLAPISHQGVPLLGEGQAGHGGCAEHCFCEAVAHCRNLSLWHE